MQNQHDSRSSVPNACLTLTRNEKTLKNEKKIRQACEYNEENVFKKKLKNSGTNEFYEATPERKLHIKFLYLHILTRGRLGIYQKKN